MHEKALKMFMFLFCLVASECKDCTVGHYCPWGSEANPSTEPLPCPEGTYNPSMKSTDLLSCLLCDRGKACTSSGLDDPDVDCAQVSRLVTFVAISKMFCRCLKETDQSDQKTK